MKTRYLTLLNVVCCICVVALHTNGCFWQYSTEMYWKTANLIECLLYFPVPCFFMITGATLVSYKERYTTKQFFLKRIQKTLIPFLFWSFYGILHAILINKSVAVAEVNPYYLIKGILGSSFVSSYWFFPALFTVYLCIPLFAAVEKKERKTVFSYLIILGVLLNYALPFLKNVLKLDLSLTISAPVVSGNLIYLLIGYVINEQEISNKQRRFIYLAALAGFLIHLIGTYIVSTRAGDVITTFKGYSNLPCLLYSTGVFLWFKTHGNHIMTFQPVRRIANILAKYTFGIYLIHIYLRDRMVNIFHINIQSLVYRLGAPLLIVSAAVLILFCLRKIPIMKRFVP